MAADDATAPEREKIFSNSTAFFYQPFYNLTGVTFHSEGLRHPEEVRAILNPKLNHEMVRFTQKSVA
jgi:hypothetical protein